MQHSQARHVLITSCYVILIVAVFIGIWIGCLSSGRIPAQEIRDLHEPAAERNEQINELMNP